MKDNKGIDYFQRGHWLSSVQEKVSFHARKKMYDIWLKDDISYGATILDIGTTPDTDRLDSNCFLKWFINSKFIVSAVSPEDLRGLKSLFPQVDILPRLTFNSTEEWNINSKSFNWAFSSAVLEHVGDETKQLHFLKECARVADNIFLSTPNKWHWLEFHTKIPFIHWLPQTLYRKLLKLIGLDFWSHIENLNLVSQSQLNDLAKNAFGRNFTFEIKTIWTLGMPSNLILIAKKVCAPSVQGEHKEKNISNRYEP